jgi:hypothetical protein
MKPILGDRLSAASPETAKVPTRALAALVFE